MEIVVSDKKRVQGLLVRCVKSCPLKFFLFKIANLVYML